MTGLPNTDIELSLEKEFERFGESEQKILMASVARLCRKGV